MTHLFGHCMVTSLTWVPNDKITFLTLCSNTSIEEDQIQLQSDAIKLYYERH